MQKRRWLNFMVVGLIAVTLVGCGSSGASQSNNTSSNQTGSSSNQAGSSIKELTIAAQDYNEPAIVDYMLKEIIEKNTSIKVTVTRTSGMSSLMHNSLVKGDIQIYSGYAGTQFQKIFKQAYSDQYKANPESVLDYVRAEELKQHGVWVSPKLGFYDNYAIAVSSETAQKYNLKTVSDIIPYVKDWSVGMDQDFASIPESGMPGLKQMYGLKWKKEVSMDYNLIYQALANNNVQAIVAYSTDGRLKKFNQVTIEDDKHFLPPEYGIVMIKDSVRRELNLDKVLEKLWGSISNEDIIQMNYLADVEKQDLEKIAHDWLVKKGLI
ncbi:MAG: ABC transporter substrate-binding protein [Desulfitobacteriaceae bacterium]